MKTKHTPGPWTVIDKPGYYQTIRTDNHVIADVRMIGGYPYNSGDAALIAAAPELLEALELAEQHLAAMHQITSETYGPETLSQKYTESLDIIRTAIAKAKGE